MADSAEVALPSAQPGVSVAGSPRRMRRLREARGQATILAVVLWLVAIWLLSSPGLTDRLRKVKGPDFTYFYTFGWVAREGRTDLLYDHTRLHDVQAQLIPPSARDYFYSVYPPQVSLVFAPLSSLPYLGAFAAWSLLTIAGYAWAVRSGWRAQRAVLPSAGVVAIFAASFPPLWYLVLHGQSTIIVMLSFAAAGLAMHRARPLAAGLALGLLACKPQWAPVVGVVLLLRGEWQMLIGMALSVAAQAITAVLVLGIEPLVTYVRLVPVLAGLQLAPKAYLMHSITAWTNLLPRPVNHAVWLAGVAVIVVIVVRVWRADTPPLARLGTLIVGAALASPHLTIYDVTVIALPLIWWAGLVERAPDRWPRFYALVFALWIAYLVPSALVIRLQLSVPLLAALFWQSRQLTAIQDR